MKLLICKNKKFLAEDKDLHTQYGFVKSDVIKKAKPGDILKSNTGKRDGRAL